MDAASGKTKLLSQQLQPAHACVYVVAIKAREAN
jgi:hypothetical protein